MELPAQPTNLQLIAYGLSRAQENLGRGDALAIAQQMRKDYAGIEPEETRLRAYLTGDITAEQIAAN